MTDGAVTPFLSTHLATSQRYRCGWLFACTSLASAADPDHDDAPERRRGDRGLVVGGLYTLWKIVMGVAATAVRPWGWYVLLASQPLILVWAGVYTIAFGSGRTDMVIIFVLAVVTAVLGFAYFYKRRTMFGATWRWRRLERWLPGWGRPGIDRSRRQARFRRPVARGPSGVHRRDGDHDRARGLREVTPPA